MRSLASGIILWLWLWLWIVATLAACSGGAGETPPPGMDGGVPAEDCSAPGDEDGNGLADCDDPACAATAACKPVCGNGRLDPGEQCDDGNRVDGDACETDCTLPTCGNHIVDRGEQCDDGNRIDGDACEADCTLPACGNQIIDRGEQCEDGNAESGDGCSATCNPSTTAYLKASNPRFNAQLGTAIALSADGSTLAVGAPEEDSAVSGIDRDPADSSAPGAGAVYVFARDGATWRQQAYIKASTARASAEFGMTVALSADGSTLAVGAIGESSAATGIDHDETDSSAPGAGAVYLFTRARATWHQQAYIKASSTHADDQFGTSVALTADGAMLAVGAIGESSAAIGVDAQADGTAVGSGAVYLLQRTDAGWQQAAYIKASNTGAGDSFGTSVALSADGTTLAVGAATEDSAATGIDGDQANNAAIAAGAAYVFTRADATWRQQAYVKASNTSRTDNFGQSVALSGDGSILAVGAYGEDSAATGIGGSQSNHSLLEAGAAYVFARTGATWRQQAYVKASNTGLTAQFGWSLALSPDGAMLAVAAVTEESGATGIGGDQADDSEFASGAVYMFRHSGAEWWQQAYVKASNTGAGDQFGWGVALAADGTLAVGAPGEASAATGIGGDQRDDSLSASGAVYVVR